MNDAYLKSDNETLWGNTSSDNKNDYITENHVTQKTNHESNFEKTHSNPASTNESININGPHITNPEYTQLKQDISKTETIIDDRSNKISGTQEIANRTDDKFTPPPPASTEPLRDKFTPPPPASTEPLRDKFTPPPPSSTEPLRTASGLKQGKMDDPELLAAENQVNNLERLQGVTNKNVVIDKDGNPVINTKFNQLDKELAATKDRLDAIYAEVANKGPNPNTDPNLPKEGKITDPEYLSLDEQREQTKDLLNNTSEIIANKDGRLEKNEEYKRLESELNAINESQDKLLAEIANTGPNTNDTEIANNGSNENTKLVKNPEKNSAQNEVDELEKKLLNLDKYSIDDKGNVVVNKEYSTIEDELRIAREKERNFTDTIEKPFENVPNSNIVNENQVEEYYDVLSDENYVSKTEEQLDGLHSLIYEVDGLAYGELLKLSGAGAVASMKLYRYVLDNLKEIYNYEVNTMIPAINDVDNFKKCIVETFNLKEKISVLEEKRRTLYSKKPQENLTGTKEVKKTDDEGNETTSNEEYVYPNPDFIKWETAVNDLNDQINELKRKVDDSLSQAKKYMSSANDYGRINITYSEY